MAKNIIGFDIGTSTLKLVQWDGAQIRQAVSAPLPDNLVKEDQILSYEAMADFIKETARTNRISGKDCAVVLPAGGAFLRRVSLPAMSVDQLAVNLPYEFRDYLTLEKDRYFYDYAVNELRRGEDGVPLELDLTAAAVLKETIAQYRAMFRRAGFKLRTAVPAECAFANLLHARGETDPAVLTQDSCILDLGHAATRVHIFSGSRFEATRVIDCGAGTVDLAIADALGVDEHMAHAYKESNHDGAQELEGPQSLYRSIATEMRKAVNFYRFNSRESNLQDAYCCGGGAKIAPLRDAIDRIVELHLHPAAALMPPSAAEEDLSSFAAAVGVAMQSGGKS